jgi:hypothetical protein
MDSKEQGKVKREYEILASKINGLKNSLDKIIRRGNKLNVAPISYHIGEEVLKEITNSSGEKSFRKFFKVSVEGQEPKFEGWIFVASLIPVGEENIINKFPGITEDVPERYRQGIKCEHCNISRYRNHSYLVKNESTGEYKQVGSSCIKDFLGGWGNPLVILQSLELLQNAILLCENFEDVSDDDFSRGGSRGYDYFSTLEIVTYAILFINRYGYKKSSCDNSTANTIRNILNRSSNEKFDKNDFEKSKQKAEECLDWIRDNFQNTNSLNDFEYDMYTVAKQEYITSKLIGYLAYLPIMKQKNDVKEEERKAQSVVSNFVGTVGEKVKLNLTFYNSFTFEGNYGTTFVYKMKDSDGNIFAWFTGNVIDKDFPFTAQITGRIKAHDTFKDVKQTILTRCKVEFSEK